MSQVSTTRRRLLRSGLLGAAGLAVAGTGLLAACSPAPSGGAAPAGGASAGGATSSAAGSSPAATSAPAATAAPAVQQGGGGELLAYIQPAYQKSMESFIVPKMKERYNVDLKLTARLSGEALTKAIAQKDRPDISIFMMDEGPWLQGKEAGAWDKIDASKVPNMAKLPAQFRDKDAMGTGYATFVLGLIYDADALKQNNIPAPTSIYDLWNPAFKKHVTLQNFSSTFAFIFLSVVNELEGGDNHKSLDPGFNKIKELAPSVSAFHGSTTQLNQIFQQKQAWVGYTGSYIAQQLAASGLPIAWNAPKEGASASVSYAALAKGAPNADAAHKFLDFVLSEEAQAQLAQVDFGAPVNPQTKLDPAFAATFPATPDVITKARSVPWDVYNAQRTQLNERWQREIESA